jgi:2-hydroxychromene-2-carboxylate isomerase
VLRLQTSEVDGEPVELSTLDAQRLSATLRNLQTSARADIDLAKARKAWAAEQALKLDQAVEQVAARRGLSREAVTDLKAEFLGIG